MYYLGTHAGDIIAKAQMEPIASPRGELSVLAAPELSPNPGGSDVLHFGHAPAGRWGALMDEQMHVHVPGF